MAGRGILAATVAALAAVGCGCGTRPEPASPKAEGSATALPPEASTAEAPSDGFADAFDLASVKLLTEGRNRYFILEPGYRIVLAEGEPGGERVHIAVLDETETVDGIETRVVEEREFGGDELVEVSRNFYTISDAGDVYYHGEDVDDYRGARVVGHGGAWRAGVKGARAGLMMPAVAKVGTKHYQEIAPGVAMDRAEIVADDVTVETPGGAFTGCLKVVETSPLEPGSKSVKLYAPDVGMIGDGGLRLVRHGRDLAPRSSDPQAGR